MKRCVTLLLACVVLLAGCSGQAQPAYEKYRTQFFDTFDTLTQLVAYTQTQEEFDRYATLCHNEFLALHKLYDRFNNYEGINNIKTINDNAGIAPVQVDDRIFDLLEEAIRWYTETDGKVDVSLGPVTAIWQDYTERYSGDTAEAKLPDPATLQKAADPCDISKIELDKENGTVFLPEPGMQLDVGGVAKGYATELVALRLEAAGLSSFLLSAGGNVRAGGAPLDGIRAKWGVGIQNPDSAITADDSLLDTAFVEHSSVVTSGDYQRYYLYEGRRMHHIIDPDTLYPGENFRAISIIYPDSGMADMLSTALFLLDYDKGLALAQRIGAEVLWVLPDGELRATEGMAAMLKEMGGATGAIIK